MYDVKLVPQRSFAGYSYQERLAVGELNCPANDRPTQQGPRARRRVQQQIRVRHSTRQIHRPVGTGQPNEVRGGERSAKVQCTAPDTHYASAAVPGAGQR